MALETCVGSRLRRLRWQSPRGTATCSSSFQMSPQKASHQVCAVAAQRALPVLGGCKGEPETSDLEALPCVLGPAGTRLQSSWIATGQVQLDRSEQSGSAPTCTRACKAQAGRSYQSTVRQCTQRCWQVASWQHTVGPAVRSAHRALAAASLQLCTLSGAFSSGLLVT